MKSGNHTHSDKANHDILVFVLDIIATSTKMDSLWKKMRLKEAALLEFDTKYEKEEDEYDDWLHHRSIETEKQELEQMSLEGQMRHTRETNEGDGTDGERKNHER